MMQCNLGMFYIIYSKRITSVVVNSAEVINTSNFTEIDLFSKFIVLAKQKRTHDAQTIGKIPLESIVYETFRRNIYENQMNHEQSIGNRIFEMAIFSSTNEMWLCFL